MIDAGPDLTLDTEDGRVLEWRVWCLLTAGYDEDDAYRIAGDTQIDLHDAVELVKGGCPPELAAEILL
jgi:hypothetical protein